MLPLHAHDKEYLPGWRLKERISGWIRLIFADKNSRNLFLFLLLNLSMAFIELLYGIWTNSLGLICDSFHMFFDCTALLAGLAASLISRWRPNNKYPYGYVRAEVLAGFVNGLFLVFISFFIFSEAVERLFEPPEVHHERLFVVSVLGFFVNVIGIFAFQHGGSHHGHSHGTSGHGHSHTNAGHGHSHADTSHHHGHSHSHSHGHSHSAHSRGGHAHSHTVGDVHMEDLQIGDHETCNSEVAILDHHHHGHHEHQHQHQEVHQETSEKKISRTDNKILQGVFLHVLADTLGSIGVILSSLLIRYLGWMVADPICSMLIAGLIGFSVVPLIGDSLGILMQRQPKELDDVLPGCFHRVSQLDGVYSVQEPHFWTLCSNVYVGGLKLEVSPTADTKFILSHTHNIFTAVGVRQVYVQIDVSSV